MPLFLRKPVFAALAVAASLIMFFGLYQLINRYPTTQHHSMQVAEENFQLPAMGSGKQFAEVLLAPVEKFGNPFHLKVNDITNSEKESRPFSPGTINRLPVIGAESIRYKPLVNQQRITIAQLFAGRSAIPQNFKKDSGLGNSFVGRFIAGAVNRVFGPSPNLNKSILEYSIDGYNLMADRDVELEKKYDSKGRVVAYMLDGEVVNIGRRNPVKTAQ